MSARTANALSMPIGLLNLDLKVGIVVLRRPLVAWQSTPVPKEL